MAKFMQYNYSADLAFSYFASPEGTFMHPKRKVYILLPVKVFLVVVIGYIILVLIYGTMTDFKPKPIESLSYQAAETNFPIKDSLLSFTIWNIGYAGLGASCDFFYDKGSMFFAGKSMVRPSEAVSKSNLEGISTLLKAITSDFYLLQEVDLASKRSYFFNQYEAVEALFPDYSATFAVNYRSPRVPLPIFEPWRAYGKVESGLVTCSRFTPTQATRYQLPGDYGWPTRIFQLDRCAAVHRYALAGGKELVVLNIHNSAYDKGGKLKAQQMAFLKEMLLKEYEAGHYVIAGGDWNQNPPYFKADAFIPYSGEEPPIAIDPELFPEDWHWIYDARTPTNRSVAAAYVKGETYVTILDFFLVSPNVQVLQAKGISQEFQFSDHQPVWMEVRLL